MPAPTFGTGVLTTSQLNALAAYVDAVEAKVPFPVYKTASQTVNNSSVLQNDNELLFQLAASTTYRFFGKILYDSAAAPDFKFGWTYPSGTTMKFSLLCTPFGSATWSVFEQTEATVSTVEGAGADRSALMWGTIVVSSTAGTLQLQWAQNAATAVATTVKPGSFLEFSKIS